MSPRLAMIAAACMLGGADVTHAQASSLRADTSLVALAEANADARRHPDRFTGATQIYDYSPGAIYEVYTAPGFVSTLLLEPGETIVTVASGDTTRWMVEETISTDGALPRPLLLLKPTRANIRTNIVLVTDRRTYAIDAIAVAGQIYSTQTAWRYPPMPPLMLAGGATVSPDSLNFAYRIETTQGLPPRWRPLRVFDDGRKTYIEFPPALATSEAPPLFITENGEAALVNFRVVGNRYVVDRLFDTAELRLGAQHPIVVRLSRAVAPQPRMRRQHWRRRP